MADLAGTGYLSAAAVVRLNSGAGAFGPRIDRTLPHFAQDLAVGDLDNDGRQDLVVTYNNPETGLSFLKGNGNGTFAAPVDYPNTAGFDSPAVVVVDLDADGNRDVVVAHSMACFTAPCVTTELITVRMGDGSGALGPARQVQVGRGMTEIAVGDFDRDGVRDLAISGDSARVYRLRGLGDGSFAQLPTLTLVADTFAVDGTDIDAADLNGDGLTDLVVAIALNGSRTAILLGNGDGSYRPPHIITEPNLLIPHQQAVADYNGDGFPDLALSLANGNSGLLEIRNGNGDGTFQSEVRYIQPPPTSVGGYAIEAADVNGDGKQDLTIGRSGAFPGFLVLANTTGLAAPSTPGTPTPLTPAQDASPAQPVTFDWTDASAATSYRIQVDDASTFSSPVVNTLVGASHFTAPTLVATRHWWRVRGINSAGTAGSWSTVRRFTPRAVTSATLSGLSHSPSTVVGGGSSQGTVTLSGPAPTNGASVALASGNAAVATVPPGVTVPAGSTSASYPVSTSPVTSSTPVTLTASYAGTTRTATLTVSTAPAPAALSTLAVSPTTVAGGATAQGTVTLTAAAPSGGFTVSLSSNAAAAAVPSTLTVGQGATSDTFAVATSAVSTSTPVTLTASAGGVTRTTSLTVAPPAANAILTVTATGRSGERVTSSPAGINVSVGSTGSASFPSGTVITLSATNGRDVVWSGACSSGGSKTRSCRFTLTGNASVTASVQ